MHQFVICRYCLNGSSKVKMGWWWRKNMKSRFHGGWREEAATRSSGIWPRGRTEPWRLSAAGCLRNDNNVINSFTLFYSPSSWASAARLIVASASFDLRTRRYFLHLVLQSTNKPLFVQLNCLLNGSTMVAPLSSIAERAIKLSTYSFRLQQREEEEQCDSNEHVRHGKFISGWAAAAQAEFPQV